MGPGKAFEVCHTIINFTASSMRHSTRSIGTTVRILRFDGRCSKRTIELCA